ncbi:hypothetical protein Fmac_017521 [Flemingia macrophylla]|uniref:Ribosomal protein S18 n=1 Tax=Flemingia macrophylla TaxID=520843 RepID=A0ABD1M2C3_9FABA
MNKRKRKKENYDRIQKSRTKSQKRDIYLRGKIDQNQPFHLKIQHGQILSSKDNEQNKTIPKMRKKVTN